MNQFLNVETRDRTVKIKGLPFNANEEDLVTFFKGYDVVILWTNIGTLGYSSRERIWEADGSSVRDSEKPRVGPSCSNPAEHAVSGEAISGAISDRGVILII